MPWVNQSWMDEADSRLASLQVKTESTFQSHMDTIARLAIEKTELQKQLERVTKERDELKFRLDGLSK